MTQCPECGPHGGKGKIALLYSWVDCLTCTANRESPEVREVSDEDRLFVSRYWHVPVGGSLSQETVDKLRAFIDDQANGGSKHKVLILP